MCRRIVTKIKWNVKPQQRKIVSISLCISLNRRQTEKKRKSFFLMSDGDPSHDELDELGNLSWKDADVLHRLNWHVRWQQRHQRWPLNDTTEQISFAFSVDYMCSSSSNRLRTMHLHFSKLISSSRMRLIDERSKRKLFKLTEDNYFVGRTFSKVAAFRNDNVENCSRVVNSM